VSEWAAAFALTPAARKALDLTIMWGHAAEDEDDEEEDDDEGTAEVDGDEE
jgi:hypothetical protein